MKRAVKDMFRLAAFALLGFLIATVLSGQTLEDRVTWGFVLIAGSFAYLDGSLKDKISDLEYRISSLEEDLSRYR